MLTLLISQTLTTHLLSAPNNLYNNASPITAFFSPFTLDTSIVNILMTPPIIVSFGPIQIH